MGIQKLDNVWFFMLRLELSLLLKVKGLVRTNIFLKLISLKIINLLQLTSKDSFPTISPSQASHMFSLLIWFAFLLIHVILNSWESIEIRKKQKN